MKRYNHPFVFIVACTLLLVMQLISCEKSDTAGTMAPNNVTGKTMTMYDEENDVCYIIAFTSNTFAKIKLGRYYGDTQLSVSSVKYEKTGYNFAVLHFIASDPSSTNNYNLTFSLLFASPNQGTVSADSRAQTFTLFDGLPQWEDSTTEPEQDPEPDPTIEIENNIKKYVQVIINAPNAVYHNLDYNGQVRAYEGYNFPYRWAIAVDFKTQLYTIYPNKKISYGYECGYKGYGNGYEYYCYQTYSSSDAKSSFSLPSALLYPPIDGPWSAKDDSQMKGSEILVTQLIVYEKKGVLTNEESDMQQLCLSILSKYESTAKELWQGRAFVEIDGNKYYIKNFKFN